MRSTRALRSCSSRAPALAPTEATRVSSSRRRAVFVFVASMAGSKLPVPRGSTINRVNANLSWWQGCHHRWRTRKRPPGRRLWGEAGHRREGVTSVLARSSRGPSARQELVVDQVQDVHVDLRIELAGEQLRPPSR